MREENFEVKPVGKLLRCECGGEIKADGGLELMSHPMKFSHTCDKCGAKSYHTTTYPTVVWEGGSL